MKIVVIGIGKIGESLLDAFLKEGYEVTAIDYDVKRLDYIVNKYDAIGIVGGGLERTSLLEAGMKDTDFVIACTERDETNILCCVLAKKMGAKKTIARVRDPECFSEVNSLKGELGLDIAINPEYRTADDIAQVLKFPSAKSVENFAGGKAIMATFDVLENSPVSNKTIKDISREYGNDFLFGFVKRKDEAFIPRGDFVLLEGDEVSVISTEKGVSSFFKKIKMFKRSARSVFIVGGGKIAYYLAKDLINYGIDVKILEKEKDRCEFLSEEFSRATVICGDGTDRNLLLEENITGADACVTLTGVDEENVIVSLYVKREGVDKVITKIDKMPIDGLIDTLGLDSVVSPRISICNYITKFTRGYLNEEGTIDKLYKLDEGIEVAEFTSTDNFEGNGVPLKDLRIKKDVLIGGIVREGNFILPTGESKILAKDKVIVVTGIKGVSELSDIVR